MLINQTKVNGNKQRSLQSQQKSEEQTINDLKLNQRAFFWDELKILLKTYSPESIHLPNPSPLQATKLDLPQQRTLHLDIPRTRAQVIPQSNHEILEKVITYFCKTEKISYKQGLNEIFGVVAVFNQVRLPWEKIWEYGRAIIVSYCNNFFMDEEFLSLQCSFSLINLLLKYHDPKLWDLIYIQNGLAPELYATPWILTLFANKMNLDIVFLFWEFYFIYNDRYLILFIVVATLLHFKDKITSIDSSLLPQTLAGINIQQKSDIIAIVKKAIDIKQCTPFTFIGFIQSSRIFLNQPDDQNQQRIKKLQRQLDKTSMISISAFECLNLLYPQQFPCPRQSCWRYQTTTSFKFCFACRKIQPVPEAKQFLQSNPDLSGMCQYTPKVEKLIFLDLRSQCDSYQGTIPGAVKNPIQPEGIYIAVTDKGEAPDINNLKVCLLEGGYRALHDTLIKAHINIEDHQPLQCSICISNKKIHDEGFWDSLMKFFQKDNQRETLTTGVTLSPIVTVRKEIGPLIKPNQSIRANHSQISRDNQRYVQNSVSPTDQRIQNHFFHKERKMTGQPDNTTPKTNKTDSNIPEVVVAPRMRSQKPNYVEGRNQIPSPVQTPSITQRDQIQVYQSNSQNIDPMIKNQANKLIDMTTNIRQLIYYNTKKKKKKRVPSVGISNRLYFLQSSPTIMKSSFQSSIEEPQKNQLSSKYERTGIISSVKLDDLGFQEFLNIIKDNKFKVFLCKQESFKTKLEQNRILLMSADFCILFKVSTIIYGILWQLQNIKIWHYVGPKAKQSVINQIVQQQCSSHSSPTLVCKIKQFYHMPFLKKISSKKQQQHTISFYFKQPQLALHDPRLLQSKFYQLVNNLNIQKIRDLVLSTSYKQQLFYETSCLIRDEFKMIITFENLAEVQVCIDLGRNFYKESLSYCIK